MAKKQSEEPVKEGLEEYIATRISAEAAGRLAEAGRKLDRKPAYLVRVAIMEWLERNGYPALKP